LYYPAECNTELKQILKLDFSKTGYCYLLKFLKGLVLAYIMMLLGMYQINESLNINPMCALRKIGNKEFGSNYYKLLKRINQNA